MVRAVGAPHPAQHCNGGYAGIRIPSVGRCRVLPTVMANRAGCGHEIMKHVLLRRTQLQSDCLGRVLVRAGRPRAHADPAVHRADPRRRPFIIAAILAVIALFKGLARNGKGIAPSCSPRSSSRSRGAASRSAAAPSGRSADHGSLHINPSAHPPATECDKSGMGRLVHGLERFVSRTQRTPRCFGHRGVRRL